MSNDLVYSARMSEFEQQRPDTLEPITEQQAYSQVAVFKQEQLAWRAYYLSQAAISKADCDLAVFRLTYNRIWHVAVVGNPPPHQLDQRLRLILSAGEPVSLPPDVLQLLAERRAQLAQEESPWVERHHRPAQPL